jgi:hypothetical protein
MPDAMPGFPEDRPQSYDEDLVYNEDTGTWGSNETRLREGGSRHRAQLVAVAKDLVYYEERT